MGWNEWRTFFGGAIHIRRKKLTMPVHLLGGVRLIVNVDRDLLAFFEAEQRTRELTVVGSCGDDAFWAQFERLDGNTQGVIRVAGDISSDFFGLGRARLLAANNRVK